MIDYIHLIMEDDTLLVSSINGIPFQVLFSDIEPYWSYANKYDIDGCSVNVWDDKLLIRLSTAGGQGGAVILWDAYSETIEHISDGSFCIAVDIDDQYIYKLLDVQTFTTDSNLQIWKVPLNCMDINYDETCLAKGIAPPQYSSKKNCTLRKLKDAFEIKINGQVAYIIAIDLT